MVHVFFWAVYITAQRCNRTEVCHAIPEIECFLATLLIYSLTLLSQCHAEGPMFSVFFIPVKYHNIQQ